jgi:parallel beta-helix repeat protein
MVGGVGMKQLADILALKGSADIASIAQDVATHKAGVATHVKTARYVIGTSTAGWTAADCDYLCDGTADDVEINNALNALPATGGEIVILDGTYNITAKIDVTKDNVSIRGNGNATILKRMFNSSTAEGVITLTSRSGCKIADLQVDGNQTSCANSNNSGIYLNSSNNNDITGNTCNNNNSCGIYLRASSNNTVTGNTCNNNNYGIQLYYSSNNNTVTGNTCIRGTGLPGNYTTNQHTIRLYGTSNSYNLISNNNCMGKAVTDEGGTGNTIIDNKWSNSSGRILESYSEKLVTLSGTSTAINLSLGNVFTHSLTGNTTYSITNAVNGQAHSFTLIVNMGSTVRTLTFPASVKWQGGEIPDLSTASKTYVLTFMSVDGGTNWLGMFGGEF